MLNKEENKRNNSINSLSISESDIKKSIIEFNNSYLSKDEVFSKLGEMTMKTILSKIYDITSEITKDRIQDAELNVLANSLKSLIGSFHILKLHFDNQSTVENYTINESNSKLDSEAVLESVSEIVFRNKKRWEK